MEDRAPRRDAGGLARRGVVDPDPVDLGGVVELVRGEFGELIVEGEHREHEIVLCLGDSVALAVVLAPVDSERYSSGVHSTENTWNSSHHSRACARTLRAFGNMSPTATVSQPGS